LGHPVNKSGNSKMVREKSGREQKVRENREKSHGEFVLSWKICRPTFPAIINAKLFFIFADD